MDFNSLRGVIESLAVGAVGGISAYWLAQRRFISERAWEKRYELYGEIFDILNQLEHSLVTLEQAVPGDHEFRLGAEVQSAAAAYKPAFSG